MKSFDTCRLRAECLAEINLRRRQKKAPEIDRFDCSSKYCPGYAIDLEGN